MVSMNKFLATHRIRVDVEWTDSNPNMADDEWSRSARHFRCVLRKGRRQMIVPFSQGPAIEQEPTAADVLDCLANDAGGYENARSFEDWCSEYGYDTDSRKAEQTYRTVGKQAEQLKRFLGSDEAYHSLLWETERQ